MKIGIIAAMEQESWATTLSARLQDKMARRWR